MHNSLVERARQKPRYVILRVVTNYRVTHLAELLDLQTSFSDDAARLALVHQHAHVDLIATMTGAVLKLRLQ